MAKKHLVHIAYHYSIEVDEDELRRDLGKRPTKSDIEQEAANIQFTKRVSHYMTEYDIMDTYDDAPPARKVRRGIGSA